ncbi:MAG: SCP2 sterol-binding domain-containing protein [Rhodospirillales bacterium]|nr:SCP2 sterol-binding domain-containing protein [Rhodospirillales bacterium]MDP6774859.1 SCP2 sterol-binding domain-containing protein [Rhodospirillales bacterium]
MSPPRRLTPPLSPVLLAGLALRPLHPVLLQPALDIAVSALRRRHPEVFERLAGMGELVMVIDPIDLPFVFVLGAGSAAARLTAHADAAEVEAAATIRGPLLTLVELLEGRLDGDALFFSRELAVEGDMEAVVALRNAVDGAELDLTAEALSVLGFLAGPAGVALQAARDVYARLSQDLAVVHAAVVAPVVGRADAQAARLRELDDKIEALTRRPPRRGRRSP